MEEEQGGDQSAGSCLQRGGQAKVVSRSSRHPGAKTNVVGSRSARWRQKEFSGDGGLDSPPQPNGETGRRALRTDDK